MAFTEEGLRCQGGQCCGRGCRHCPHGHYRVTGGNRVNRITTPTLLIPPGWEVKETGWEVAVMGPETLGPSCLTSSAPFSVSGSSGDKTEPVGDRSSLGPHDYEEPLFMYQVGALVPSGRCQQPLSPAWPWSMSVGTSGGADLGLRGLRWMMDWSLREGVPLVVVPTMMEGERVGGPSDLESVEQRLVQTARSAIDQWLHVER